MHGFELRKPKRPQVSVQGTIDIELDNPEGLFVGANFLPIGQHENGKSCQVVNGPISSVRCDIAEEGQFGVNLFATHERAGDYFYIARVELNNKP
jgi:hypothetical protein